MSNKALASEFDSNIEALRTFIRSSITQEHRQCIYSRRMPTFPNDYSEGTSEQASFDLCMGPEETKEAETLMNEAELLLQQHSTSTDDYKLYHKYSNDSIAYYKKRGNTLIFKFNHKIKYPGKYNYIISILWNSNAKYVGDQIVKEKVACAYSPNLMIIQQRYKNYAISLHGYYYALAKKVQVSDDTTVIIYTSSDIDYYNSVDKKKYTKTIVESANSFKPKIYSENDIRNGELTRMFININTPIFEDLLIRIVNLSQILNILRSTTIISKK
ncbi:fam-a protein [Plasmodium berghei]|uniref:Fam-a protein n=1 Tax=Plasmodium berghei TaxID=5821 RepID=A0A122HQ72_PLABE|nr:fam-a protein [Plasmodium berghei]